MEDLDYQIDRGKRKNVYISIQDGKVVVKIPKRFPEYKIKEILKEKEDWIYKKLKEYNNSKNKKDYKDGQTIYIFGEEYTLKIDQTIKKRNYVQIEEKNVIIYISKDLYLEDKDIDEKIIEDIMEKFYLQIAKKELPVVFKEMEQYVGLHPSKLKIQNMKRAWGNCNSKKEIHLNKNLIKYSKREISYVCIHELCHLKYMNHSKDFWNMVAYYMPEYKMVEKELK